MDFSRVDRLQSQLVRDLAIIVSTELQDRPPFMLTFTRAEISKDLRYAKVYYSVLGDEDEIEKCFSYLKRHAGIIRKIVGKRMRIKHLPEISYIYDAAGDNVQRISDILSKLKAEENE